jgi:hypothetical protein
MKPPVCTICKKHFGKNGGLIFFLKTESDKKYNARFKQAGFVGHPSNVSWFCEKHYSEALKYKKFNERRSSKKLK